MTTPPPVATPDLGPWATGFAATFLIFGSFHAFRVVATLSVLLSVPFFGLVVGAALVAPKLVVQRIPVSIPWVAFVAWSLAASTWSYSPVSAQFVLKRDVAVWLAFALVGGLMPWQKIMHYLLWFGRLMLVVTIVAVATMPSARTHIDFTGVAPNYPGWHGLFDHKNVMTPVLILMLVLTVLFDKNPKTRWLTLAAIGVVVIGSTSMTGVAGSLIVVALLYWLQALDRVETRLSAPFIVSSVATGAAVVLGIVASLSAIVEVAGKDLTFTGRTDIWAATWHAIEQRPLFGYGLGGLFSNPPTPTTAKVNAEIGFDVPHAHSGMLELISQVGFIGGALFVIFMGSWIVSSVRVRRVEPALGAFGLALAAAIVIIGLSENVYGGQWFGFTGMALAMNSRVLNEQKRLERAAPLEAEYE